MRVIDKSLLTRTPYRGQATASMMPRRVILRLGASLIVTAASRRPRQSNIYRHGEMVLSIISRSGLVQYMKVKNTPNIMVSQP